MPTVLIHTGPQSQERDGQFAARDGPARDRFGMVGQTFWAGHSSPPFQGKLEARLSLEEKDGTSEIPSSEEVS